MPTISSTMLSLLRENPVKSDEQMIQEVLSHFPSSKIDRRHVAWYKTQFRAGRLKGQNEPETFNQPVTSDEVTQNRAERVKARIEKLKAELKALTQK